MKNFTQYDDGSFTVKNGRCSYPHVFEKYAKPGDEEAKARYSCTLILPNATHAAEIAHIKALLVERQKVNFKMKLPAANLCLRDGDLTGKPEYEDSWILVASDKKAAPAIMDRTGKVRLTERDDKIYAGAIINMRVSFWDQNNNHGKKINANLIGVQFMDHGEPLSTVTRPAEDETFESEGESDNDGFD